MLYMLPLLANKDEYISQTSVRVAGRLCFISFRPMHRPINTKLLYIIGMYCGPMLHVRQSHTPELERAAKRCRCHFKCTKFNFGWSSATCSAVGSYSASSGLW